MGGRAPRSPRPPRPIGHDNGSMLRFNHIGIPTTDRFDGEIALPRLKLTVSDHRATEFRIQWQRYDADAPYPDLVKNVAHVAFEVDDLEHALKGQHVIIAPNSPTPGVVVAFIEVIGAPVELMSIDRAAYQDSI
jgi:hypothetical protein